MGPRQRSEFVVGPLALGGALCDPDRAATAAPADGARAPGIGDAPAHRGAPGGTAVQAQAPAAGPAAPASAAQTPAAQTAAPQAPAPQASSTPSSSSQGAAAATAAAGGGVVKHLCKKHLGSASFWEAGPARPWVPPTRVLRSRVRAGLKTAGQGRLASPTATLQALPSLQMVQPTSAGPQYPPAPLLGLRNIIPKHPAPFLRRNPILTDAYRTLALPRHPVGEDQTSVLASVPEPPFLKHTLPRSTAVKALVPLAPS